MIVGIGHLGGIVGFEDSLGDPSDPNTPESDLRALATSKDPVIRIYVANNPSTPADVLEMLASQPNIEQHTLTREQEASIFVGDGDKGTTWGDRVNSLWDVIGFNPSTPEAVLERLYFEGGCKAAISARPYLPHDLAWKIWDEGDNEYLHNIMDLNECLSDALMIRIAVEPDIHLGGGDSVKTVLAARKDCPPYLLEILARQPIEDLHRNEDEFRGSYLRDLISQLPTSLRLETELTFQENGWWDGMDPLDLDALLQVPDVSIRHSPAWYETTDPDVLAQLAVDPDVRVRTITAHNTSTPLNSLQLLATDPDDHVRYGVASNRSTPIETLKTLLNDGNKKVSDAAKGTAAKVWYGVAGNPATPVEILTKLGQGSGSPHWWPLFCNVETPTQVRERIANYILSDDVLLDEVHDIQYERYELAARTSTPPTVLTLLAKCGDEDVREAVADNTSTPPEVLAQLATDSSSASRYAVAGNTSAAPGTLASLAQDSDEDLRQVVAGNTSTPPEALDRLLEDPTDYVRHWAARNASTPAEALERLVEDADDQIRRWLAVNPSAPDHVLAKLADDPDQFVRKAVARNPSTPPEVRAKLASEGI